MSVELTEDNPQDLTLDFGFVTPEEPSEPGEPEQPSEPGEPAEPEEEELPQTGIASSTIFATVAMFLLVTGGLFLFFTRRISMN